ncbi:TRAP-type C4-dicarboxylate transport system, small permease component [Salinihabitans flavidus]|uniref:TRAP transporter small permease protein n=1 Tax=Salinihabitans flavidus TaxID=569882 RepID=A0A1H8VME7_9RHOB|nr:TRAP transporter small permease [Salinihabitans flavidus]SEP16632.1 TRAP-type C4-dicarboxylate transport system, small permease component [Salinihabitans flavidus]
MINSSPLQRWRDRLTGFSGLVAGVFLLLMMLVTVVDVTGRYFLNAPLPGAFEMTQFLMAAIVYSGLPNVSQRESHITIDLLDSVTPDRLITLRDLAVNALCCSAFAVLSWRLWVLAGEAAEWGDTTQYLGWPLSPIIRFGATLCAVTAVIHLGKVLGILCLPNRSQP